MALKFLRLCNNFLKVTLCASTGSYDQLFFFCTWFPLIMKDSAH